MSDQSPITDLTFWGALTALAGAVTQFFKLRKAMKEVPKELEGIRGDIALMKGQLDRIENAHKRDMSEVRGELEIQRESIDQMYGEVRRHLRWHDLRGNATD